MIDDTPPPMDSTPPLQTAPTYRRVAARIVDVGVQLAILEVAGVLSDTIPYRAVVLPLQGDALTTAEIAVGLASMIAYLGLSEAISGATLGKLLADVRVTDLQGRPPGALAAVLRNVLLLADGFLFGLPAWSAMSRSPQRQRIGDTAASTRVVRGSPGIPGLLGTTTGVIAALGLLLGSYVVF